MSPVRTLRDRIPSPLPSDIDGRPAAPMAGPPGASVPAVPRPGPALSGPERLLEDPGPVAHPGQPRHARLPRHAPPPKPPGPLGRRLHALRAWLRALTGPQLLLVRAIPAALAAALLVFTLAPLGPAPASGSTRPKRIIALRWAEHRAGKWYCWGGTGPSCFDCSGLVYRAYRHAGIRLPRTTSGMLASRKLRRIPASKRHRGDLAFYGSGHVELVTKRGTFGALQTGTRIGWHHPNRWWHPTMYFRVRRP